MSKSKTVVGKYVFLDIVSFSYNRTVEAQSDIIDAINKIVKDALSSFKIPEKTRILIPTGDGMCIALLNMGEPFDIHMGLALKIMELLHKYNESVEDEMRKFDIRIGINENTDNLIIDINGNRNVAGAGITEAQRVMDQGDRGHILVGRTVYNHLRQRENYMNKFKVYPAVIKHKEKLEVYQFVDQNIDYLNSSELRHLSLIKALDSTKNQIKTKLDIGRKFVSSRLLGKH